LQERPERGSAPIRRSARKLTRALAAPIALLVAANLLAHDFWIAASELRVPLESLVKLRLFLGPPAGVESVKRDEEKIREFFSVSPSGARAPVPGVDGADPAGYLRVKEKGVWAVGYRSRDAFIELEPSKFQAYLEEEGLDAIIRKRRDRKETLLPG